MTAKTLRRAAALMRERADAATPAPWADYEGDPRWYTTGCDKGVMAGEHVVCYQGQVETANALHIASWDPAVALAVARVLEAEADDHDRRLRSVNRMIPTARVDEVHISPASLALARLYLGEIQSFRPERGAE